MPKFRGLALLCFMAACGGAANTDPCSGISGVCIGLRISGTATGLDQLGVTLDNPAKTLLTPDPAKAFKLPAKVALVLPAGTTGTVNISLDGFGGGVAKAHDAKAVTLPKSGRVVVEMTLDDGTALDGGTDGPPADLAMPDLLAKPPITIAVTGQTTVFELEHLTINITATDPLGLPLSITVVSGTPTGATLNGTGGNATLDWTPSYDQAGTYPIMLKASSLDGMRSLTETETITVNNAVDLIPNITGNVTVPGPNAIGDFDMDNFGDVAYCSVAAGPPAAYTVQIIYGAPGGIAKMVPADHQQSYTFNHPGGQSSSDNANLPCMAGDFNGDGFSDVMIGDPNYNAGTGTALILYGKPRAQSVPSFTELKSGSGSAEALGTGIMVGDYNGDGLADVAAINGKPKLSRTYFWYGQTVNVNSAPANLVATQQWIPPVPDEPCGARTLLGAGDVDGNGKSSLLVYDPNLGASVGQSTCPSTLGGLQVVSAIAASPNPVPSSSPLPKPATAAAGFGSIAALCDVDRNSHADLVVLEPGGAQADFYFWPNQSIAGAPDGTVTPPGGNPYTDLHCAAGFFGASTSVLHKTGGLTSGLPGVLDLVPGGGTTPFVASKPIVNPEPTSRGFGIGWGGLTDVNGDGKPDIVVGSHFMTDPVRWWVVYSR